MATSRPMHVLCVMFDYDVSWVWILPRMSRCCSEWQLLANTSMSESHTVRLAVRKSLRSRGRPRARCWKQPVLLWSVGHQPRSNSSSILTRGDQVHRGSATLVRLQSTEKKKKPPAAVDELHQTSIGQVPAAPQVQRAEEPGASSQHAGHDVVVFNLQQRSSSFNTLHHLLTTKELLKTSEFLCIAVNTFEKNFRNAEMISIWCPACKCTWLEMGKWRTHPDSLHRNALPDHLRQKRNVTVFQEQICVCEAVIVLWCLVMLSIFHPFIPRWKAKKCNFTAGAGSLSIEMTTIQSWPQMNNKTFPFPKSHLDTKLSPCVKC